MQAENGDDDDDVRVRITAGVFTGSNEDYLKERRRTFKMRRVQGWDPVLIVSQVSFFLSGC